MNGPRLLRPPATPPKPHVVWQAAQREAASEKAELEAALAKAKRELNEQLEVERAAFDAKLSLAATKAQVRCRAACCGLCVPACCGLLPRPVLSRSLFRLEVEQARTSTATRR